MKKLDLNIKLDKPTLDENKKAINPVELAQQWIGVMLERALNKPDKDGRPTITSNMEVQSKYFDVMNKIRADKKGIVELDDDVFNFLDRKYHQAEIAVQSSINEVLMAIKDAINKAKVEEKK